MGKPVYINETFYADKARLTAAGVMPGVIPPPPHCLKEILYSGFESLQSPLFHFFSIYFFLYQGVSRGCHQRVNEVLYCIRVKLRPNCLPNEEDASRADNEGPLAVEKIRAALKDAGFAGDYDGLAVNAGYFPPRRR
ncbi:MAG: hypothetical protein LBB48_09680 [Treponema sp.]|nr:hypothetical protein [Treponema sp.]